MKIGFLRQDESSHWYAVPSDKISEFDAKSDIICDCDDTETLYAEVDEFNLLFSKYRLNGGISNVKVILEE